MSAFITRRGGGNGGGSVVTGTRRCSSARLLEIPDLAGKSNFSLTVEGYGSLSEAGTVYTAVAIFYRDGVYTMACICGEYIEELTSSDGYGALEFDDATGCITLDNSYLDETLRFKSKREYRYVGW